MNILKVHKVSYKYGKKKVLDNVSFEVGDGLIGVLGANGAGKTTLMKLLTTLYRAPQGEICLNQMDYKTDMEKIRGSLGYLPQGFKVYNNVTGREFLNIMAELKVRDKISAKKEIETIVKRLSMEDFINDRVRTYSGGMKQKLGFAQVLLGNPSLNNSR